MSFEKGYCEKKKYVNNIYYLFVIKNFYFGRINYELFLYYFSKKI